MTSLETTWPRGVHTLRMLHVPTTFVTPTCATMAPLCRRSATSSSCGAACRCSLNSLPVLRRATRIALWRTELCRGWGPYWRESKGMLSNFRCQDLATRLASLVREVEVLLYSGTGILPVSDQNPAQRAQESGLDCAHWSQGARPPLSILLIRCGG